MSRTAREIRDGFLAFFEEHDHAIVPSSSLIPASDPTLLFTNAGMNQFKDVFLGTGTRPYTRAADTQKVVRVEGKHNDLEEVGQSPSHHTFFEMLGNWSFGDYFKEDAIRWAWELLTDVWGLPKDRLYATVFGGDEKDGVAPDEETERLWNSVTDIDPSHVRRFGKGDNFWEMGETGPCGPCSEIHVDLSPDGSGAGLVNAKGGPVVEIWNLVFIQYNRGSDGTLVPLPAKHVDTGMGFERICAVLQGKSSNYDTDLFAPLLAHIGELAGTDYATGDEATAQMPMRVIADHARMLAFTIADGALPSNEGRGYVLRRVLRRAVRYGRILGFEEPFLHKLVPTLVETMGYAFPEVREWADHIARVIQGEEESFGRTLDRGLELFDGVADRIAADGEDVFPGDDAFLLYDTHGFPFDLTQLMASERDLRVDEVRFNELMEEQRARARGAAKFVIDSEDLAHWQPISDGDDSAFTGYNSLREEVHVRRARVVEIEDGKRLHQMALDRTPFYPESGGQIGDQGTVRFGGDVLEVLDTRREEDGTIVHTVDRLPEDPTRPGLAEVYPDRRRATRRAHSATHLLHASLRRALGSHVAQAGSLVAPDRLRFDFTHYEAVPPAVLADIEDEVNAHVLGNHDVSIREMPLEDAKKLGAMALFGEKYGDVVRTVAMEDISLELCGGTHVSFTAEIGALRIVRESSIAAGVRRIEASTGLAAHGQLARADRLLNDVALEVGARTRDEVLDRTRRVLFDVDRLEDELANLRRQLASSGVDDTVGAAEDVGGVRVVATRAEGVDRGGLRDLADIVKQKLGSGVVVVAAEIDGKPAFVAAVTPDVIEAHGIKAGDLAGAVARVAGGGGGGRPDLAQAGGRDAGKIEAALAEAAAYVRQCLAD